MLEPVHVGSVTVSTANLRNEEDLARKDVRVGDEVVVDAGRGRDSPGRLAVDPGGAKEGAAQKPKPPAKCPGCGTPTVNPEDAVFTICPNRAGCPGQAFQHVKHFVSKGAMDIDGLGEKQGMPFLEEGLIDDVADIYDLDGGATRRSSRGSARSRRATWSRRSRNRGGHRSRGSLRARPAGVG